MPGEWETFYLMVGSSAAALIGLLFVVLTLSADFDLRRAQAGSEAFVTPTAFHFGVIVFMSAVAIMPAIPAAVMGGAGAVPSVLGIAYAAWAARRISRSTLLAHEPIDYVLYVFLPAAAYLGLLGSAVAVWLNTEWGFHGIAIAALGLLLIGIRDAWDLAVYLAYHKEDKPKG